MTMDRFRFPVAISDRGRMTHTYASVTGSILKTIKEAGHGEFYGKLVCPPDGKFQIVLYPGSDSGLGAEYQYGKVRLLFSYPNLYLEAFESRGVWHRFKFVPAHIVPGGVSQRLPFEGGYHNRGMQTDFTTLRFGKSTIPDIYKVLGAYPDNPGGINELKEALSKVCVVFPEAIRFPELRRFLVFLMKWIDTQIVLVLSRRFNSWRKYSRAIREGPEEFEPIPEPDDVTTFDQLLSLVAVLLHVAA